MANYDHLAKLRPTMKPRPCPLHGIPWEPVPTLMVLPATAENGPLWRAVMKRAKGRSARSLLDPSRAAENRDQDRALYARYVVKGWDGIRDTQGQLVPFSEEECGAFLAALPDHLFDEVRLYCGDPSNFVDEEELSPEEEADLGEG